MICDGCASPLFDQLYKKICKNGVMATRSIKQVSFIENGSNIFKFDLGVMLCVFIPSPIGEGSTFLLTTGVKFFPTELKPVRRFSADVDLKRFQHKVFKARRKPTPNIGEFTVAQPIAHIMLENSYENLQIAQ